MIVKNNFKKRKEDVDEAYKLLDFILSVETHRNNPLQYNGVKFILTQEMQCILKAQFLIVLYNMVESTVYDCLNAIYDTILDEKLVYSKLSMEMKNMWQSYLHRNNLLDKNKTDKELENMPIYFENLAINISGNLDFRKIKEIFEKHGCILDLSKRDLIGESLLIVKSKRNSLAHGDISFSTCGSNYLLSDLKKFQEHIIICMEDVVDKTYNFLKEKKYQVL
jgi:hypothetical protein